MEAKEIMLLGRALLERVPKLNGPSWQWGGRRLLDPPRQRRHCCRQEKPAKTTNMQTVCS